MNMRDANAVANLKAEADFHGRKAAEFAAMAESEPAGEYRDRLEKAKAFHGRLARRRLNEARRAAE